MKNKYIRLEDVESIVSSLLVEMCATEEEINKYFDTLEGICFDELLSKDEIVTLLKKHYLFARPTSQRGKTNHIYDLSPLEFNNELLLKFTLER